MVRVCLITTGVKPDEELIAGIILANLPDRFEPLIMALKNFGEEVTVCNVKTRLLVEDVKSLIDDGKKHVFVSEKFKGKKSFKGKCFNCNLYGHKSSSCQKLVRQKFEYTANNFKKDGNGSKQSKKEEANVAGVCATSSNPNPNISFMDSCASYHMTPYKELIDLYKNCSIQKIKTGSSVIEDEGEGSVMFRLSRNKKKVQVIFSNILHVPKLTVNLLSIKYLNKTFEIINTFAPERCFVYKDKHLVATETGVGDNLYSLDLYNEWALISSENTSNELLQKKSRPLK